MRRRQSRPPAAAFSCVIVSAFICFATASASAAPALWLVEHGDTRVYLFGTVHALKPGVQWHTPALDQAIRESDELWLEVPHPSDSIAMLPLIRSLGMDPQHPLSTKVPKADIPRIDAALKASGGPPESAVEPFRPWLVGVMLAVAPMLKAGYDDKNGVDDQVGAAFASASKPIRGLETIEQQLHVLADMPEDRQVAFLESALDETDSAASFTDGLVSSWLKGDVDRFASVSRNSSQKNAAFYDALITQRNVNWARQIDARLKMPGTAFVAVGAAHLGGSNGVPALLQADGYVVRRVQ